ncbi:hypothetical protein MKX47_10930 [Solibacillus sp. FSL R7-0668]
MKRSKYITTIIQLMNEVEKLNELHRFLPPVNSFYENNLYVG